MKIPLPESPQDWTFTIVGLAAVVLVALIAIPVIVDRGREYDVFCDDPRTNGDAIVVWRNAKHQPSLDTAEYMAFESSEGNFFRVGSDCLLIESGTEAELKISGTGL